MADDSQTISIPSLILLAAVTTLAIRYFFFTKADPNAPRSHPRAANPADIEQIATMFPQLNRRDIIWDLQRNGGSVAATTERVLSRGTLEQPPPSFQPPIPAAATPSTAGTGSSQPGQEHIDLIKRYKLESKISESPAAMDDTTGSGGQMWSNNKTERQALLQRRREEMILKARRKLEEKERGQSG